MAKLNSKLAALVIPLACLGALVGTSCGRSSTGGDSQSGTSTGNPTTPGTESLLLTSDASATSQTVAAQVDSTISAAATENDNTSVAGLMLAEVDKTKTSSRYRNCTVSGNDAVVTISQAIERDFSFTGPRRTLTDNFSSYYKETRTWSKADGSAEACGTGGKYAAVTVAGLGGMNLVDTVEEDRARQITLDNTHTNTSTTSGTKFSLTGTRNISWQSSTLASGTYTILKTATHTLNQTIEVTKKDGTTVSLSSSNAVGTAAPLKIEVVRDGTTLAVLKHIIQSGEVDSTFKDGTTLSSVYANVEYDAGSATPCVATSGTITGTLTPAGGTASTYTITFGDSPTITFASGSTTDYVQDGCAFDEAVVAATDAASASAVTAPSGVTPATPADGMVSTGAASGT